MFYVSYYLVHIARVKSLIILNVHQKLHIIYNQFMNIRALFVAHVCYFKHWAFTITISAKLGHFQILWNVRNKIQVILQFK